MNTMTSCRVRLWYIKRNKGMSCLVFSGKC